MIFFQVIACHLAVFYASYRHFGFWDALAITAALYMIMPYRSIFVQDVTPK
jgi:hypothetical protein